MKLYKDCELKGQILRIILLHGATTSRFIFESIKHPNYNAFRSELNLLKRRGYLTITNDSKPYIYKLTSKGCLHAQDPFLTIKRRQKNAQLRVAAVLNNDMRFRQIVDSEVHKRLCQMPFPASHFPPFFPADPYQQAAYILDQLNFKDGEILRLRNQLQQTTRTQTNVCQTPPVNPKNPINQKPQRERALYRPRLAELYVSQRRLLDSEFFNQWGDVFPCHLRHIPLFRKGSVGLMSASNPETGNNKRMLDPNEIDMVGFHIIQLRKEGIVINGKGMNYEKLLRW
jgi:hypothetical protein